MTEEAPKADPQPAQTRPRPPAPTDRAAREAAALRANLARRKAQARSRETEEG